MTDKKVYSSKELLEAFDRVSKKIIFWGCGSPWSDTEKCIEKRIQDALKFRTEQYERTKSQEAKRAMNNLKTLINHEYPYRWTVEAFWINPHPIYKERLGIPDEEYNRLVEEKKKVEDNKELQEIIEYERYLRSKRLKKRKRAE